MAKITKNKIAKLNIVRCHFALGIIAWYEKDYEEAFRLIKIANEEQQTAGQIWEPRLDFYIQQLETMHLTDNEKLVFIAAKQKENLDELIELMIHSVNLGALNQEDIIVTNVRHFEILKNAHEAILRVLNGLDSGITGDFLAQDIRECMHYMGEITGEITTHEVLGHIFKNFGNVIGGD